MEYNIKEKAENPRESTIEMHGKPITFNLHQIEANVKNAEKMITELDAQSKVNRAKMSNIEEHHPFIKDMTEMQLHTAHMYFDAKSLAIVSEKKADEFREAKAKDEAAKAELFEKMPEFKAEVDAFDAMVAGGEKKVEEVEEEITSDNQ